MVVSGNFAAEFPKNAARKIWGFPKIRGTFFGVPIIRIIVFWGLYWVPLFWETTILKAQQLSG